MSTEPRRFEPSPSEVTAPFWDATRRKEFLLQWCLSCEAPVFYPRQACPRCWGSRLEWRAASGNGVVHAVSIQHRPAMPLRAFTDGPYVVALIELAEGPHVMSNVVGCSPEGVTVGMPVVVTWEPMSDGRNLPQFEPAARS